MQALYPDNLSFSAKEKINDSIWYLHETKNPSTGSWIHLLSLLEIELNEFFRLASVG